MDYRKFLEFIIILNDSASFVGENEKICPGDNLKHPLGGDLARRMPSEAPKPQSPGVVGVY